MSDVMNHFHTTMVPSILLLQKASSMTSTVLGNHPQTVVDFVNKLIVFANGLSDKTKVCIQFECIMQCSLCMLNVRIGG